MEETNNMMEGSRPVIESTNHKLAENPYLSLYGKDKLLEFRTKVLRPNFPFGGNLLCRFVIQIVGRI